MKVGIALNMLCQAGRSDASVVGEHLAMGDLAEPLGFDSLFALEHHFTGYAMSPAPTQLLAYYAGRTRPIQLGTAVIVVLTVLYRPDAKGLVLITAATVAYGYLMKPLGLVVSTAALVFISAYGGHEFKWKEVAILFVILIIFSVLVFVKGLTLPFPLWPEYFS